MVVIETATGLQVPQENLEPLGETMYLVEGEDGLWRVDQIATVTPDC